MASPQRSSLILFEDGDRSQPVEVTVERAASVLATVNIDYEPEGVVTVRIKKGEVRSVRVEVDS